MTDESMTPDERERLARLEREHGELKTQYAELKVEFRYTRNELQETQELLHKTNDKLNVLYDLLNQGRGVKLLATGVISIVGVGGLIALLQFLQQFLPHR